MSTFDPLAVFQATGQAGLVARLLELRGLLPAGTDATSASELLDVFRSQPVIEQMRPKQDWFLRGGDVGVGRSEPFADLRKQFGPDLIATQNSANWVAVLQPPSAGSEMARLTRSVRVLNPESSVVYGELPLDDFLLRMAVQELVWIMAPPRWDRRRIVGAHIAADTRATGGPETDACVAAVEGLFPADVAVGPDWIVTHGGYTFATVHILRHNGDTQEVKTTDNRFERARERLGGDWS